MAIRLAYAVCLLGLLALRCRSPEVASPPASSGLRSGPSGIQDARARGVEFRASGNEPGWTLEILADRLVFVGDYGATRATVPRPTPQATAGSNETAYVVITEAHRLTVRIRPGPCVDSMSGEPYEASVELDFDGRRYHGCGRALGPS